MSAPAEGKTRNGLSARESSARTARRLSATAVRTCAMSAPAEGKTRNGLSARESSRPTLGRNAQHRLCGGRC
jgi:hypothetical protein